jgi:WD40 repeat protein
VTKYVLGQYFSGSDTATSKLQEQTITLSNVHASAVTCVDANKFSEGELVSVGEDGNIAWLQEVAGSWSVVGGISRCCLAMHSKLTILLEKAEEGTINSVHCISPHLFATAAASGSLKVWVRGSRSYGVHLRYNFLQDQREKKLASISTVNVYVWCPGFVELITFSITSSDVPLHAVTSHPHQNDILATGAYDGTISLWCGRLH